jgi:hypothetical protein
MSAQPNEQVGDEILDETDSGDLQVEVVEDVSEKPRKPLGAEPELPEDDDGELAGYGAKVKKRISKLTFEAREQRRQAETVARERDAAVEFANRALSETRILKKALNSGREIIASEAKGRVSNALEIAKANLRSAKEMGDIDKEIEASQEIARLTLEADKVASFKPVPLEDDDRQYVVQPRKPEPDEKAKDWHARNSWFGKDETKTAYARHVHEKLVVFENVDPRSDKYWKLMDNEMAKKFTDLAPVDDGTGDDDEVEVSAHVKRKPGVVVAPVNRNTKPPRKVTLTASEVAIAKRLGLTLQQYAESKVNGSI